MDFTIDEKNALLLFLFIKNIYPPKTERSRMTTNQREKRKKIQKINK